MSESTYKFQKITKGEWTWHLENPSVLKPWFFSLEKSIAEGTVKKNNIRTVFVVDSEMGRCYVKHEKPLDFSGKLKAFFRSKALAELKSAELLHARGVPLVEYLGWGRKGPETMLISKALLGAVDARLFWFDCGMARRPEDRSAFLDGLSVFLKSFLASGLYHPDLHLGNLLVLPEERKFVLVDPYGIRPIRWKEEERFQILRLAGAMRGELSAKEATDFLSLAAGIANTEAAALWARIVAAETEEMQRLWPKRREQILAGSKYCSLLTIPGGRIAMLRHSMGGAPLISEEALERESEWPCVEKKELPRIDAEALWLASFQLQFERAPQVLLPYIWEQRSEGTDVIFFKQNSDALPVRGD